MATVAPVYEERRVSIGRVFERAVSTVSHNPVAVLVLALVLGALPSALFSYLNTTVMASSIRGGNMSAVWGAMLVSWVFGVVVGAIVQAALTRATVADNEGHRVSIGDCIAAGARVFLPLIGVGLIFAIAMAVGLVLLIIPGVLVMVIWSVAAPALVVEREGVFRALGRSAALTKGSRWRIFGLFLLLAVIYMAVFLVLGVVGLKSMGAGTPGQFGPFNIIASVVTALVFNLVWGTIQPSLYLELREAREGDSIRNLEEVFA